jgi:hypothetical protein
MGEIPDLKMLAADQFTIGGNPGNAVRDRRQPRGGLGRIQRNDTKRTPTQFLVAGILHNEAFGNMYNNGYMNPAMGYGMNMGGQQMYGQQMGVQPGYGGVQPGGYGGGALNGGYGPARSGGGRGAGRGAGGYSGGAVGGGAPRQGETFTQVGISLPCWRRSDRSRSHLGIGCGVFIGLLIRVKCARSLCRTPKLVWVEILQSGVSFPVYSLWALPRSRAFETHHLFPRVVLVSFASGGGEAYSHFWGFVSLGSSCCLSAVSRDFEVLRLPPQGKIFLGGLDNATTKENLLAYCSEWGEVTDHVLMEGRGFGFVTYADPANAAQFLEVCFNSLAVLGQMPLGNICLPASYLLVLGRSAGRGFSYRTVYRFCQFLTLK